MRRPVALVALLALLLVGSFAGGAGGGTPRLYSPLDAVAFSPDGLTVAVGGDDGAVRLWDARTLRPIGYPFGGGGREVDSLAFTPDGRTLAVGYRSGEVRFWDPRSEVELGTPLRVRVASGCGRVSVAFTPKGQLLTAAPDDRIWNIKSGQEVGSPFARGACILAVGKDGHTLATGAGGKVRLWDLRSRRQNGRPLVRLWEVRTQRQLQNPFATVTGQSGGDLAFSRNGQILAAGDSSLFLRDVAARKVATAATNGAPAGSCRPAWRVFAHSARVPPLSAVAARSEQDVWAVGGASGGISSRVHEQAAVVHWDGRTLSTTRFRWRDALLADVAIAGPNDVWSVGSIGKHALALHWDGRRWRRVNVWRWSGAWLTSVAAITSDDVWAVGGFRKRPLVAHWNGRRWHVNLLWRIAPNHSDLRAVAASPRSVWASGEDGLDAPATFGFGDLEVRWDGRHWHRIRNVEHSNYDNVAEANAVAPNREVWELSEDYSGNGTDLTRWAPGTGRELSNVSVEIPSLSSLDAIAPLSHTNAWAVGGVERNSRGGQFFPAVAHWNGHHWRLVPTPLDRLGGTGFGLHDITAITKGDLWAVGNHLVARYSC